MNRTNFLRAFVSNGFIREVRGALPLSLTHSLAKECGITVYGNTKKYTTIDGVKYAVPDDVILLDNAGSTVSAFFCTKNGSTGTIDLTTGAFTAATFTAGKMTRTENFHSEIPTEQYTELTYLGLSDNSYFNTGVHANPSKTNSRMKVLMTELSGTTALYGARSSTSATIRSYNIFGKASNAAGRFDNVMPSYPYVFGVDTWYNIVLGHNGEKGTVTIDGTLLHTSAQNMEDSDVGEILIGNINNNGTPFADGTPAQWAYVEIAADGTDIDFRGYPVRRESDDVVGFYNAEDGAFTVPASGTATAGEVRQIEVPICEYDFVGDRTENLFDMKYDVGYSGTYPNITEESDGKSTEWIETDKFGSYFWIVWNIKASLSSCIMGLVYSDDKENILFRKGIINTSAQWVTANTDCILGGSGAYAILHTYKYVKAYCVVWSNVNRLGFYASAPTEYIPFGYNVPVRTGNQGVVDLGTLYWNYMAPTQSLPYGFFRANVADKKPLMSTGMYLHGYSLGGGSDKHIWGNNNTSVVAITDSRFTDAAAFKAAMRGKYLYYQRTTDAVWNPPALRHLASSRKLGKIGTYIDTASIKDGVRTSVFRMGHIVFSGAENVTLHSASMHVFNVAISVPYAEQLSGFCTHYGYSKTTSSATMGDKTLFPGSNKNTFLIRDTSYDDAETFKAMLARQYAADHPVEVWYPLAEAVTETAAETNVALPENDVTMDAECTVKPTEAAVTFNSRSNY